MRAVTHLFVDGFRGFDPSLTFREAQLRELRRFHHSKRVLFEYAPIIHKRKFSKPMVLHIGNLPEWRLTSNQVNTLNEPRVNDGRWRNYPARWAGSGVPRLLSYRLLHRT